MSKLLGCELDSLDEGVMLGASSGDVECHDADGSGALPSGSSSSASRAPVKKQQREERFEPSALDLKLKINRVTHHQNQSNTDFDQKSFDFHYSDSGYFLTNTYFHFL